MALFVQKSNTYLYGIFSNCITVYVHECYLTNILYSPSSNCSEVRLVEDSACFMIIISFLGSQTLIFKTVLGKSDSLVYFLLNFVLRCFSV